MIEINLSGKTYPLRATMRAWKRFEDATGQKVAAIDDKDITMIPQLIYYFVQEGCKANDMNFKMTVDDFLGIIEIGDLPILSEAVQSVMGGDKKKSDHQSKALTWDEIEEMGLGQLRLNPFSLYNMTFNEFGNAMAGHYKEIEQREQAEWERTRWLVNPHVKKRITPKDLATFPWEKQEKAGDGLAILRQIATPE